MCVFLLSFFPSNKGVYVYLCVCYSVKCVFHFQIIQSLFDCQALSRPAGGELIAVPMFPNWIRCESQRTELKEEGRNGKKEGKEIR